LHAAKEKSRVNFDDLHYLLSLNQARALTLGVEWFRSRQPVCMGTLYWQLNDCWPGSTSWSCLDYGGGKKPLWYATRRFYAPQLLTIQPEGDALVLYANNDSDDPWQGAVRVRRMDFAGNVKGEHQVALMAEARRNVRLGVLPTSVAQPRDRAAEFIVADTAETARATYFFLPDKELNYPVAEFEPVLSQVSGGYELTINSRVLLRDVLVQADRIDPQATVEENLVTVLPGEAATFRFGTARRMTAQELTRPPVFNCANRFGRRS
jgi:beta-mannosidase